jgi:hypothetical protein
MRQRYQQYKRGYAKRVRTLAPRVSLQADVMVSPNRLLRNQANLCWDTSQLNKSLIFQWISDVKHRRS